MMYAKDVHTGCALIAPKEQLDYFSQDSCTTPTKMNSYEAYCEMTASPPRWLKMAFTMRDKISSLAGVQPINGFASKDGTPPQQGDKLDFFDVVQNTENELILTAIDRHLGVLLSVETQHENQATTITITASVKNKNFFGVLYMIPVKPAHELIVRNMLRKLV